MNLEHGRHLDPMEVLHAVRKGYALATPFQLARIGGCPDFELLDGGWVPRWALEALSLLESAACEANRIRDLFSRGRGPVQAKLAALVREGRLPHEVAPRHTYVRQRIDRPTEMAMTAALQQHRERCPRCRHDRPCVEGEELEDELQHLFPVERRKHQRT